MMTQYEDIKRLVDNCNLRLETKCFRCKRQNTCKEHLQLENMEELNSKVNIIFRKYDISIKVYDTKTLINIIKTVKNDDLKSELMQVINNES